MIMSTSSKQVKFSETSNTVVVIFDDDEPVGHDDEVMKSPCHSMSAEEDCTPCTKAFLRAVDAKIDARMNARSKTFWPSAAMKGLVFSTGGSNLWRRRHCGKQEASSGPPSSNRNPCRFPLYDDCEVKRIVPPTEALFTIMSQDEIPPMPVMESVIEGGVSEELSDTPEDPPEESSDTSEVDDVADDEHETGSFGQQREKQHPCALLFASENLYGQTNQNSAAIPSGLAGEAGFEKVLMSKESLKEWKENRKALRAARRAGRKTYGEYLKGQSDSQPLSKPLEEVKSLKLSV